MGTCFNLTADAVFLVYIHHCLCPSTPAPSCTSVPALSLSSTPAPSCTSVPALAIEKFLSSSPLLNFFTGDRRCIFSEILPQKLGLFCKSYFSEILPQKFGLFCKSYFSKMLPQKLALSFESNFSKMLPQNLTRPSNCISLN